MYKLDIKDPIPAVKVFLPFYLVLYHVKQIHTVTPPPYTLRGVR